MFKSIFKHLLDLLFPKECQKCLSEGAWLCQNCFENIKFNKNHYCLHCKNLSLNGQFCHDCKSKFQIDGILIACNYKEYSISRLIKLMKYGFAQSIAEDLGRILSSFLNKTKDESLFIKALFDSDNSLIIPVPLHKKREKWRGFNQSQKISEFLSKQTDIRIKDNLIRIKNTKPQVRLNAEQRKENIKNCFSWQGENLKNKNILLIDDVVTTGSTLNECSIVLKTNGAGKIWGLVIANG